MLASQPLVLLTPKFAWEIFIIWASNTLKSWCNEFIPISTSLISIGPLKTIVKTFICIKFFNLLYMFFPCLKCSPGSQEWIQTNYKLCVPHERLIFGFGVNLDWVWSWVCFGFGFGLALVLACPFSIKNMCLPCGFSDTLLDVGKKWLKLESPLLSKTHCPTQIIYSSLRS